MEFMNTVGKTVIYSQSITKFTNTIKNIFMNIIFSGCEILHRERHIQVYVWAHFS